MASGTNPFEAASPTATIARILEVKPAPLSTISLSGLGKLDQIVGTCLRKSPDDRAHLDAEVGRRPGNVLVKPLQSSDLRPQSSRPATGSVWWWRAHQLMVTIVDVLMLYPVWRARSWLPTAMGHPVPVRRARVRGCVGDCPVAPLVPHRGVYPAELPAQRRRALSWTRVSDVGFSAVLLLGALGIAARHRRFSTLFVAVAVASALRFFPDRADDDKSCVPQLSLAVWLHVENQSRRRLSDRLSKRQKREFERLLRNARDERPDRASRAQTAHRG